MIGAVELKQELKNTFGKVYLTIEVDLLNHWIHTTWAGHQTEETTRMGTEAYTKAVKESGFSCVLNDSRLVLGGWDHSLQWALQEWVPMALGAGIKRFAFIDNPNSFSSESAKALANGIHVFEMRVFDSMPEAKNWLQNQCLKLNL